MNQRITIEDVAQAAGVSTATVSRVLMQRGVDAMVLVGTDHTPVPKQA